MSRAMVLMTLASAHAALADDRAPPPLNPPQPYVRGAGVGPEEITDFDVSRPPPPGYTPVAKKRVGLIVAGAVTFGVSYGSSVFVALLTDIFAVGSPTTTRTNALYYPIAGPFIDIGREHTDKAKVMALGLGLAQTTGVVLFAIGMSMPKHILVRDDHLSIAPMVGNGTSGVVVLGSF